MKLWDVISSIISIIQGIFNPTPPPLPPPLPPTTLAPILTTVQSCPLGFSGPNCQIECGLAYYNQNLIETKISGGLSAQIYSWPSQVLIRAKYKYRFNDSISGEIITRQIEFYSTGSLIDQTTVLTAASSIKTQFSLMYNNNSYNISLPVDASLFSVYLGLGSSSEVKLADLDPAYDISPAVKVNVNKLIPHPKYSTSSGLNDIALIKLSLPVNLNEAIQIACLPPTIQSSAYPPVNSPAISIGWGAASSNDTVPTRFLKNVLLNIYANDSYCGGNTDATTQICSGKLNYPAHVNCEGDNGGPLFVLDTVGQKVKFVQAGIISGYDMPTCSSMNYSETNSGQTYTRISAYLDWIMMNK